MTLTGPAPAFATGTHRVGPYQPNAKYFGVLWDILGSVTVPVMLVRGMRPQSVVDDKDEAALLERVPTARVEHVQEAGHSVQGDAPLELAARSPSGLA